MNTISAASAADAAFIAAPEDEGPISRRTRRRTMLAYLAMCLAGIACWLLGGSPGWQATGIGLLWPGAGFVAVGGWALLLVPVTLVLFGAAVFAWFGAGMVIAPPIVWLGSALAAGALAGAQLWAPGPYVAIAAAVYWQFRTQRRNAARRSAAITRREIRNVYLPAEVETLSASQSKRPPPDARELTPAQVASLRYLFDRALQPIGRLEGFDHIEQFQPSALRYQLNQLGYTLALAQCQYTPSFHGYLAQAQRNLIDQALQEHIWNYWRYERLWGKLSLNDDPAGDDNIMLTGFFGLQVALYTGNTGDRRYAQPGGLGFLRGGKVAYAHDLHSVIASIVRNFDANELCLYPCEPNWVYTFCNFRGLTALLACDRIFGTHHASERLPRFLHQLDAEFTTPDGSLYAFKSNLTGLAIGGGGEAGSVLSFNVAAPERARRAWAVARRETVDFVDGRPALKIGQKGIDFGNYTKSHIFNLYQILCAAREMGDDAVAEATLERLDALCELNTAGGQHHWKGSTMAVASAIMGLLMRRDDWRSTVLDGPPPETASGPILAGAAYPQVLVAKALSHGDDLDLVLYPGAAAGEQVIGIERLKPGAAYLVHGDRPAEFVADTAGCANLRIVLDGRTALSIRPRA
ncbi:MAG: hypothetical protein AB7Q97_00590 [Gammaproteobacteria bacterium]